MGKFKTNYGYVKLTNWYSYHMLNLKVLDFFDYAGKLDNDVSFVAPFPEPNLPLRLINREAKMLATQKLWYFDSPRVTMGIKLCLTNFIELENKMCSKLLQQLQQQQMQLQLQPAGLKGHEIFWEGNMNATFRSHFLVYWLGLYASPEVKVLAKVCTFYFIFISFILFNNKIALVRKMPESISFLIMNTLLNSNLLY
jgi:hypothetical protein